MSESTIEETAQRAVTKLREAIAAAHKYNDFGGVLGAQDEVGDIHEQLVHDLRHAIVRSTRLVRRIEKWEAGDRTAELLDSSNK